MTDTSTQQGPLEPTAAVERKTAPAQPLVEEIELTPMEVRGTLVPYDETLLFAPKPKPFWRRWYDFPGLVLLPLAVAAVYLFAIASDRYVSETKYVVRSSQAAPSTGIDALAESHGMPTGIDDTYVVNEYMKSRDMVRKLEGQDHLREILGRQGQDPFVRFPNFMWRDDFENLYRRFKHVIDISLDEGTGISTLRAVAHRPEDAKALVMAVMGHAEAMVNAMNDRAHDDMMRYAQMIVDKAREKTAEVEDRLTAFRNAHTVVDPGRESSAALEMIGRLSEEQAKFEATLGHQEALTPGNPGNEPLRQKIEAYKAEIAKLRKTVVGSAESTAASLAGYESLVLERDLAAKSLDTALVNFEHARSEAQQQHLYIETIAAPNLSDVPEYPKRLLDMAIVGAVAIGIWLILRSLRISAEEHSL